MKGLYKIGYFQVNQSNWIYTLIAQALVNRPKVKLELAHYLHRVHANVCYFENITLIGFGIRNFPEGLTQNSLILIQNSKPEALASIA